MRNNLFKKIKNLIAVILTVVTITSCSTVSIPDKQTGQLSVVFIDTGNSDSIFIDFPDGRKMLVDAGNPDDKNSILDVLRGYNTKKLDYIVITHPHSDHIGSFPDIMKVYGFDKIYMPKCEFKDKTLDEIVAIANQNDKKFTRGKAGVIISDDDVYAEILSPMYDNYGEENNYSIVIYLKYGETSFLFTGDAELKVENDLLNKNKLPHADVLKIGHHGSQTSSSKNFLNMVKPDYAVITTGKNSYGHPAKKVVDMLHAMSIKTYRTDLSGNITFVSDGKKVEKK